MAINHPSHKAPKRDVQMSDYWPRYRKTVLTMTILMQIILTLVVGTSLLISGSSVQAIEFWMTILATSVAAIALNIILVFILLSPHKDIVTALVHVSGGKTDDPMPSPNARQYERNGFKLVLQYIYEHATGADIADSDVTTDNAPAILQAALNQTQAGVVILDADGVIQFANRNAPIVKDTEDKPQLSLIFEREGEFEEWLNNCRESSVRAEKTWRRIPDRIVGDEDRRIFDITANYEKGSAAEVVLVMFDSSAQYQPEDNELDFIAFAAHELRGPITVIRGYLDVLDIELSDKLELDQKQLIKRLIVSSNRLSGYINNILNTSKYDRRHLKIHLAEDTLANVYDMIRDDMDLRAQSQNRLLAVNFPSDLPTVAADRSSLSEVISNLIDNALKYSNEGGSVYVTASVADANYVKVSVQDNGIGMPSNVVGNLFHKFYRSHRSRETVAGTGIGLYICKAIVESHGGTIEVSSIEGQGSTFAFTVPIYASVADKLQANDHTNAGLISSSDGWIKNHTKFKG